MSSCCSNCPGLKRKIKVSCLFLGRYCCQHVVNETGSFHGWNQPWLGSLRLLNEPSLVMLWRCILLFLLHIPCLLLPYTYRKWWLVYAKSLHGRGKKGVQKRLFQSPLGLQTAISHVSLAPVIWSWLLIWGRKMLTLALSFSPVQSTPSGKKFKFVATGHGQYKKVLIDEATEQ